MSNDKKLFWAWLGLMVNTILTCASIYYIVEDMNKVRVLWGMQGTLMTIGVLIGLSALQSGHESGHTAGYLDGMNDETPIDREGISEGLRRRIIERDAFTCSYCHGEGEPNRDPDGNVWEIDLRDREIIRLQKEVHRLTRLARPSLWARFVQLFQQKVRA